ncbi:hypothetical protein IL306_014132 [Fusarium sp. DS 682]|nr:hypothetical protein IL306_014132 [Fusarium sp. DS 682]
MTFSSTRRIRLVRLAHVYYSHSDIAKAQQFLTDFGFYKTSQIGNKTYYRGTGPEPFVYCAVESSENSFGGAAFVVETLDDLKYAAQTLPGATSVTEMESEPGGGYRVTFYDPVDKFPFHLVYGQKEADPLPQSLPERNVNFVSPLSCIAAFHPNRSNIYMQPTHKNRPGNTFQRFEKGPAPVHKLGHFGMVVTNFEKAFEFYTSRFNFKPSDVSISKPSWVSD